MTRDNAGDEPADQALLAQNRPWIALSILVVTIMISLDTTIANVALPHIQGSISASADQITWVLTSYIVAAAIMTPMTGWVASRFGARTVFIAATLGFTLSSALCGLANSLTELVLFRFLQGLCGAVTVPLSQSVLADIYPLERRGQAMAMFGMGAMLGPIMGPALGGWLTDNYNWRWVFYINLPFGILASLGFWRLLPRGRRMPTGRFDILGFASLALALTAFQLFLDRGQQKDWFSSPEVCIELALAGLGLWWTVVQTLTAPNPFVSREVLKDKNFLICAVVGFFINVLLFATLALLPPMLEVLMGYPVVTTGIVTAPRGFGTMLSMFIVGRLIGRVDVRLLMLCGLLIITTALWRMTHVNLQMDASLVVTSGVLQGIGVGLIFVPLSTVVFATLAPNLRTDAASIFTLVRNMGSSVGISVLQFILYRTGQASRTDMVANLRPDNPNLRLYAPPGWSLSNPQGLAYIDAQVSRQAGMLSYVDCFKFMLDITLLAIPLVLFLRPMRNRLRPTEVHVE